jgi:hypothetical protein
VAKFNRGFYNQLILMEKSDHQYLTIIQSFSGVTGGGSRSQPRLFIRRTPADDDRISKGKDRGGNALDFKVLTHCTESGAICAAGRRYGYELF